MIGVGITDMTPIGPTVRATTGLDTGALDGQAELSGVDQAQQGALAMELGAGKVGGVNVKVKGKVGGTAPEGHSHNTSGDIGSGV